jgi:two-component system, response regulator PdtaR
VAKTKKTRQDNLEVYLKQIGALSKVANLIASGLYLDELLRLIVHVTAEVMNSKISSLMLIDEEKGELVVRATQSISEAYNKKPNLRIGEGIAGIAAKENKTVVIKDLQKEPRYVNRVLAKKEGLVSLASVPLTVKGKVIGVLNCYTSEKHEFTRSELELLIGLATQAAIAIENAELAMRAKSAEDALATRKLIERAKEILSEEASVPPAEAYRLIQKQSMDSRKSMRDIAEAIILAKDLKCKKTSP